jgi:TRAP-type mannitol/chloroaromatic compound transport system permease small subunit
VLPLLVWLTWGLWDYWYGAFKTAEKSGQSAWNPPVWPFRLVLFLGILAWTLQTIAEVVKSALWSCRALPLWTESPHMAKRPNSLGRRVMRLAASVR